MSEEIECIVFGRVQMVLYRDFAQRKATALGLTGTVENLPDGSVRVLAQGEREQLKLFLEHLRKGPVLGKVHEVKTVWRQPIKTFHTFTILR